MKYSWPLSLCVLVTVSLSCASMPKVERVPVGSQVDVSGQWNDYDALKVSEEMVSDSLRHRWLKDYLRENGREPVVIVGPIVNRTYEHIDSSVFVKYL